MLLSLFIEELNLFHSILTFSLRLFCIIIENIPNSSLGIEKRKESREFVHQILHFPENNRELSEKHVRLLKVGGIQMGKLVIA